MRTFTVVSTLIFLTACVSQQRYYEIQTKEFAACDKAARNWTQLHTGAGNSNIISTIKPEYPHEALNDKRPGCVVIAYDVNSMGQADNFRILEAVPRHQDFMAAAVDAMLKWELEKKESKDRVIKIEFRIANLEKTATK